MWSEYTYFIWSTKLSIENELRELLGLVTQAKYRLGLSRGLTMGPG